MGKLYPIRKGIYAKDKNYHFDNLSSINWDICFEMLPIYTDSSLGPILGFKGGTAANFFYDLGRFSVDLDFDLLKGDKEAIVFEKIEKILREYGTIPFSCLRSD